MKIKKNYPKYNDFKIKAYAVKNKNDEERRNSTSGGVYKILAKYVIDKKGVVFGVKYNDKLEVVHDYAEELEKCKQFSYSKYVRSNLNDSYIKVKKFLEDGRFVLFTGTPCQNQGLKSFLGKDYEKLILCEIICHANPSPKVFKMYKKNIEIKHGKEISNIFFRSKNSKTNNSAYFEMKDGTKIGDTLYNYSFSGVQLINRPSCYKCNFVTENRKSDFTIGDFWGIENIFPDFDDKAGISLLTVNSLKAEKIFKEIEKEIAYKECDLKIAFERNHNKNVNMSKNREKFFAKLRNDEIDENNIIYYMKKYTKKSLYRRALEKGKRIIKKIIKRK